MNTPPSHFFTLASYAVSSLLFNGSDRGRRLFFPYLTQSVHELISENALLGGFASTQSKYLFFNAGLLDSNGPPLPEHVHKTQHATLEPTDTTTTSSTASQVAGQPSLADDDDNVDDPDGTVSNGALLDENSLYPSVLRVCNIVT